MSRVSVTTPMKGVAEFLFAAGACGANLTPVQPPLRHAVASTLITEVVPVPIGDAVRCTSQPPGGNVGDHLNLAKDSWRAPVLAGHCSVASSTSLSLTLAGDTQDRAR